MILFYLHLNLTYFKEVKKIIWKNEIKLTLKTIKLTEINDLIIEANLKLLNKKMDHDSNNCFRINLFKLWNYLRFV